MLKKVIEVARVPVKMLAQIELVGHDSVRLPENLDIEYLSMKLPASVTIVDKIEDHVRIFEHTLKFRTCQSLESNHRYAYVIKLIEGERFLLGTKERPYPVTTVQDSYPENVTENQLLEISVSLRTTRKWLRIVT